VGVLHFAIIFVGVRPLRLFSSGCATLRDNFRGCIVGGHRAFLVFM
jgi:hypothetical protein